MRRRVLIVDDQPLVREVLQCMLESKGFDVTAVSDADAALDAVERLSFDAALVDMDMPRKNGLETLRALRAATDRLGCPLTGSLMTGVPTPELEAAAERIGARAVLTKPFSTKELLKHVDALCALTARLREAA